MLMNNNCVSTGSVFCRITIPMMIERLQKEDCKQGWLLDGFPRSKDQAITLANNLKDAGIDLDYVIEIVLDRQIGVDQGDAHVARCDPGEAPQRIRVERIALEPGTERHGACGYAGHLGATGGSLGRQAQLVDGGHSGMQSFDITGVR